MSEARGPRVYSIAAHRGFADALVAGLAARYENKDLGLARLTLMLPSQRASRAISEAFIRYYGAQGQDGLLMPRMAVVGDLDLAETLGPLLDPLASTGIPPAVDPTFRWLTLARLIELEMGTDAPTGAALMRMAHDLGATMDRLLIEDVRPEALLEEEVVGLLGDLSDHWRGALRLFARVQQRWLAQLDAMGRIDAAARRNRLFTLAAQHWRVQPPDEPIVAAGVTSAAPALARLLKVIANLPNGAVILPDLDLAMDEGAWDELGVAGGDSDQPFARSDAVTHPQYHLKLLLNRMGIARAEVRPWHRKGLGAGPPERSYAISSLFLPPQASREWVSLLPEKRRLSGVRIMETATPEEEAQAIALLVRQAIEQPGDRVAVVTPDRGLARRVVQHLRRWNIAADDSAGLPLSQTAAGRLLLLLAESAAERFAPVGLMALLGHPLVKQGGERGDWLRNLRAFERALRGPRPAPGLAAMRRVAEDAKVGAWWQDVETALSPLSALNDECTLAAALETVSKVGEHLCGEALWSREDGRALADWVGSLLLESLSTDTRVPLADLPAILRDRMDMEAVRPAYGGHPRVAIYGLLESRMTQADLVICGGLNEGVWPATPAIDPLLAPAILRKLGVPGSDFRIGLAAHDLAGALGAQRVVLSRAARDIAGPTIPSRFLLRVKALLGDDLIKRHRETTAPDWARLIDSPTDVAPLYPRPEPCPTAAQRQVAIAVTALDRLRGDPYQFYAQSILGLRGLDALDAEPSAAWQGTVAHEILERWHRDGGDISQLAGEVLAEHNAHPLMTGIWLPRLLRGLEWVVATMAADPARKAVSIEQKGSITFDSVRIHGRADRIDRLADGSLAIVDYKTGKAPSTAQVEEGFALQLGLIGLIAQQGGFDGIEGTPSAFEYWSLAKNGDQFGKITTPVKQGRNRAATEPEDFVPMTWHFLADAISRFITGTEPFTAKLSPNYAGYDDYDQLMRLEEWLTRFDAEGGA